MIRFGLRIFEESDLVVDEHRHLFYGAAFCFGFGVPLVLAEAILCVTMNALLFDDGASDQRKKKDA